MRSSGYDLRVAQLCALIPDELHLVVAPLYPLPDSGATMDTSTVFASVTECPPILGGSPSLRRHLRLDNLHYLRASRPREFADAQRVLADLMARHHFRRLVVFGEDLVELVADIGPCTKVLDVCDSTALSQSRALEQSSRLRSGHWLGALELYRARRTEARLPTLFAQVTTVSAADSAEIVGLSGITANVFTVPNGVDEAYLEPMPTAGDRRGVVFWGNLDFAPNADALAYFLDEVWLPRLRQAGVEVEVVGSGAPRWLVEFADREPQIRLTGFVPDLRPVVSRFPVMVNPMRTGSGMKNKVLEAFGLGIVVVSTSRGAEGLSLAEDGEHLLIADDAAGFAAAVLDLLDHADRRLRLRANANALVHERYRWGVAARAWRALFGASFRIDLRRQSDVDFLGG